MKKVIKAQLYIKMVDLEKFKKDCDKFNEELDYCISDYSYSTYIGEYENKEVISIDVELVNRTAKEVNNDYSLFKKLFKDFTGQTPKQVMMFKLDRF